MGEEVEELVKRLRERAYAIAAVSSVMADDTLRNTQIMVAAANELESLRASLTRVEEENAAIREAQHKLKSSVHYIAGFLEATARRHERGELSANEYTQRLTDCAVILLEANAGQHTARLSRATSAEGK